jgi:YVTN family beta-propeller protein
MNALLLTAMLATSLGGDRETELPVYVGRVVCLQCHSPGRDGGTCTNPPTPKHDRAYEALAKPEAREIAALCGVPQEPARSQICLGCHTTAAEEGPRWTADTFDLEDGVQCEACHGAGSRHVEALRGSGSGAAKRGASELVPTDRWICSTCHQERASHQDVLERGYRRSPLDLLYKRPVNLACSPDGRRLYVVCENSNSLVVVDAETGKLITEIQVGRRPNDIAVSPDGKTLYVTNRLDDSLTLVDASQLGVVADIPVGDEPHGVLADAAGRFLFVLNTDENDVSVIDAWTRTELRRLTAGHGPWSAALSPDGRALAVTNVRPDFARFREPHHSEINLIDAERGLVTARPLARDANMLKGIAFVPGGPHRGASLFTLMRTKNLVPATRLAQGWVITNGLGVLWPDGRIDQVLLDQPADSFPDPNDVAVNPDGSYALVTSGGSDRVAVVDLDRLMRLLTEAPANVRANVLPNHQGTSSPPDGFVTKLLEVGHNPRGVLFSPDGRFAYVANALDDSLTVIEADGFNVIGRIDLGGPRKITELRRGERLFHSAESTYAKQFSCQSCHPDGHINGLSMDIEADGIGMKPVDNRTLRGILDTAPFKWEGTNPTLQRQCGPRLAVFLTRLEPFAPADLQALVRYISTIERPPNRYRADDGLTPAQYRGKIVFDRAFDNYGNPIPAHQRCITCHNNPYKTALITTSVRSTMWYDAPVNVPFDVDDVFNAGEYGDLGSYFFADTGAAPSNFDVPHLNNIYDSAPYLHNGSAKTLEEIWTKYNMLEGHGLTRDMTRRQFNDLIAYLKTF